MQQHTPWSSKQKPPLGLPKDIRQKWSQASGPVGHNVEVKQRFPFGNGTSPATIIKNTLEILSNTMEKLKLKIYMHFKDHSHILQSKYFRCKHNKSRVMDLVSYLKPSQPSQMKHK